MLKNTVQHIEQRRTNLLLEDNLQHLEHFKYKTLKTCGFT